MNYPPGMTRTDWQHIDGERHDTACPMHEEYEHRCEVRRCGWTMPGYIEPGRRGWQMTLRQGFSYVKAIPIDFCPWCGEELPPLRCICSELKEVP